MASTLTKLLLHVTFSTRHRDNLIDPGMEPELYAYIGGICRNMHSPLLAMGGTANHVHMLISQSKTVTLADIMLNVKRDSSKWLKDRGATRFQWQDGYFAFSIGESGVKALRTYIANQKAHHRAVEYQDEMRAFFQKYKLEFDERYIWQ